MTPAELVSLLETPLAPLSVRPSSRWRSVAELAAALATSETRGLPDASSAALERRRAHFGANAVPPRPPVPLWRLALAAASDPTVLVLIACGAASLALELGFGGGGGGGGGGGSFTSAATATAAAAAAAGAAAGTAASPPPSSGEPPGWIDGAAILAAVAVVVSVTAVNDFQKEAQFSALAALSDDPLVTVRRLGATCEVRSSELVVGDLLLFEVRKVCFVFFFLKQARKTKKDENTFFFIFFCLNLSLPPQ